MCHHLVTLLVLCHESRDSIGASELPTQEARIKIQSKVAFDAHSRCYRWEICPHCDTLRFRNCKPINTELKATCRGLNLPLGEQQQSHSPWLSQEHAHDKALSCLLRCYLGRILTVKLSYSSDSYPSCILQKLWIVDVKPGNAARVFPAILSIFTLKLIEVEKKIKEIYEGFCHWIKPYAIPAPPNIL